LEEKQKDQHTRLDVEERIQDFKCPHHRPIVQVKLGRGLIQVLQKSTLKSDQGYNDTQDLKQTSIHEKKGGQPGVTLKNKKSSLLQA